MYPPKVSPWPNTYKWVFCTFIHDTTLSDIMQSLMHAEMIETKGQPASWMLWACANVEFYEAPISNYCHNNGKIVFRDSFFGKFI